MAIQWLLALQCGVPIRVDRPRTQVARLLVLLLGVWFAALACHAHVDDILDNATVAVALANPWAGLASSQASRYQAARAMIAAAPPAKPPCAICEWLTGTPGAPAAPLAPLFASIHLSQRSTEPAAAPTVAVAWPFQPRAPPQLVA